MWKGDALEVGGLERNAVSSSALAEPSRTPRTLNDFNVPVPVVADHREMIASINTATE